MTDAVQAVALDLPAGNGSNAAYDLLVPLGNSVVTQIIITFPPGTAGLVGVNILSGGAQLYPLAQGTWFIFDDYTLVIPVTNQITTGQWQIGGYNADYNPHTVRAYFYYDYLTTTGADDTTALVSA